MDSAGTYRQNVRVRPSGAGEAHAGASQDRAKGEAVGEAVGEAKEEAKAGQRDSGDDSENGAGNGAGAGPTAKSPFIDPSGRTCPHRARLIVRMQRMAFLLDSAISIPGTKMQFGLDPLIGLIPVVGDAISMILSFYIVVLAWRIGVKRSILALMVLNVFVDFVMGLTPVLGDAADAVFKANLRNLKLLGLSQRW